MATALRHDLETTMRRLGEDARAAARHLATTSGEAKDRALHDAAASLRDQEGDILAANAKDMAAAEQRQLSPAMLDRLALNPSRVEAMAAGLEAIVAQDDPVGAEMARWQRPNGRG